jgi:hypothetical protein
MKCASVKKKGSKDQCDATAIFGHTLCGRHARCKAENLTLWANVHSSRGASLTKYQALVRGFLVRRRLAMGGPGVLKRGDLANDEDLETCEEKEKEHPFTYFGFEEGGKIWWFHFHTLWRWCLRQEIPTNPYTKVPLTPATRTRLRSMMSYQRRHGLELPSESSNPDDRLQGRWNIVCQLFSDNGFGDLPPSAFARMNKNEIVTMFRMLRDDLYVAYSDKSVTRKIALHYCMRILHTAWTAPPQSIALQGSYALMLILLQPKSPYVLAFTVLSALYRC